MSRRPDPIESVPPDDRTTLQGGDGGAVPDDDDEKTMDGGKRGGRRGKRPTPPTLPISRYKVLSLLARGGQGDVWVVVDRLLQREQALKIVREGAEDWVHRRFLEEIERTVFLAHPGVVHVSDQGLAHDGRPWFVMQRVRGDDLGEVVRQVFAGDTTLNLRRLVELLTAICSAVQHAHGRRILHRDLTPRNVMVGEFGEALVMDWGLARSLPEVPHPPAGTGRPAGTRGYIAPECYADPGHLHPQVDVFGLGGILFKVLTSHDPPEKRGLRRRDFPLTWADGESLPAELVMICIAAMATDPVVRLPSAEALRQRLVDWLDGARRRDEALAMVEKAQGVEPLIIDERRRAEELSRQAAVARRAVPDHAPVTEKYPVWALEDRARAADDALARSELEFERLLGAALTREPDLAAAHELLARHHKARAIAAREAGDRKSGRRAEALVRHHQRGEHADWLDGRGRLDLLTEPRGARVTLHPLVLENRRRVPGPPTALGPTPIIDHPLAPGSYVALIESDGRPPVRYPVHIERSEHWHGVAPGEERAHPIALVAPAEEAVYVPAGWARLGGDPEASVPLPRSRIWVDGFVMQRFAVTHRQWIAFLDDLEATGDRAGVEQHQPRNRDGQPVYLTGADGVRSPPSEQQSWGDDEAEPAERAVDPGLDAPVALIDWTSAMAYADWLRARTGYAWRLPTPCEWEKAARGVDGRLMPWGDEDERSWYRSVASFAGRPRAVAVGECPEDESVYGVRDMAGTIRQWCINSYRADPPADDRDRVLPPEGPRREVRGGSWTSQPNLCRPAGRMASRFDQRFRSIGLRLVYSVG